MSTLGRISLILGLVLLVIGVILATMNFINIRDYWVALSANKSAPIYNVNPRIWVTYGVAFASGLLLGIGIVMSTTGRRRAD